ncbi:MAG: hypothetical protein HOO96_05935 [Polyangiaceae bacterium]|nr:hypothetical protein [Polyangiaceae bacterium]
MRIPALLLGAFVLVAACGSSSLAADDYDQSCSTADDCVTVLTGDQCDCACESGSINKRESARYASDAAKAKGRSCDKQCSPCPALPVAVCNSGTCGTK